MVISRTRSYTELSRLNTFDERFRYLKMGGGIGRETFGFDRHVNQMFYRSREWRNVREFVIVRDNGCDLGVEGYEIGIEPLIHHVNPIALEDIVNHEDWILDSEFLITTTHRTHNAIHFGTDLVYPKVTTRRSPRDTNLW